MLQYGTITTPADLDFPSRLVMIYDDMVRLMDALKPDAVAVEELFGATMSQRALEFPTAEGHFTGGGQIWDPLYEYTPLQVKQAVVGYGKAEKKARSWI